MRPQSSNFINAIWDNARNEFSSEKGARFAIIGSSGIGKSCGLTYLLRLAVLARCLVIYESRPTVLTHLYVSLRTPGNTTGEDKA